MKKRVVLGLVVALLLMSIIYGAGGIVYRLHQFRQLNPASHYFDSNGTRLHYRETGSGAPLILVHGLAVNGDINFGARGAIAALASRYRVISMDNRGHGHSEKPHDPEEYGVEMSLDIVRLMDHLDIEKAHVLGYSMGGFIVLKLASLHPERLLSFLVCASGWTAQPEEQLDFFRQLADALDRGEGYGTLSDRLTPLGRTVSKRNRFLMSVGLWLINDSRAIAALLRSMPELAVEESMLRENTVPAFALVGERDPLRPFAEEMAGVTANMRFHLVPDADHMSTLGKPGVFDVILSFLDENTPAPD